MSSSGSTSKEPSMAQSAGDPDSEVMDLLDSLEIDEDLWKLKITPTTIPVPKKSVQPNQEVPVYQSPGSCQELSPPIPTKSHMFMQQEPLELQPNAPRLVLEKCLQQEPQLQPEPTQDEIDLERLILDPSSFLMHQELSLENLLYGTKSVEVPNKKQIDNSIDQSNTLKKKIPSTEQNVGKCYSESSKPKVRLPKVRNPLPETCDWITPELIEIQEKLNVELKKIPDASKQHVAMMRVFPYRRLSKSCGKVNLRIIGSSHLLSIAEESKANLAKWKSEAEDAESKRKEKAQPEIDRLTKAVNLAETRLELVQIELDAAKQYNEQLEAIITFKKLKLPSEGKKSHRKGAGRLLRDKKTRVSTRLSSKVPGPAAAAKVGKPTVIIGSKTDKEATKNGNPAKPTRLVHAVKLARILKQHSLLPASYELKLRLWEKTLKKSAVNQSSVIDISDSEGLEIVSPPPQSGLPVLCAENPQSAQTARVLKSLPIIDHISTKKLLSSVPVPYVTNCCETETETQSSRVESHEVGVQVKSGMLNPLLNSQETQTSEESIMKLHEITNPELFNQIDDDDSTDYDEIEKLGSALENNLQDLPFTCMTEDEQELDNIFKEMIISTPLLSPLSPHPNDWEVHDQPSISIESDIFSVKVSMSEQQTQTDLSLTANVAPICPTVRIATVAPNVTSQIIDRQAVQTECDADTDMLSIIRSPSLEEEKRQSELIATESEVIEKQCHVPLAKEEEIKTSLEKKMKRKSERVKKLTQDLFEGPIDNKCVKAARQGKSPSKPHFLGHCLSSNAIQSQEQTVSKQPYSQNSDLSSPLLEHKTLSSESPIELLEHPESSQSPELPPEVMEIPPSPEYPTEIMDSPQSAEYTEVMSPVQESHANISDETVKSQPSNERNTRMSPPTYEYPNLLPKIIPQEHTVPLAMSPTEPSDAFFPKTTESLISKDNLAAVPSVMSEISDFILCYTAPSCVKQLQRRLDLNCLTSGAVERLVLGSLGKVLQGPLMSPKGIEALLSELRTLTPHNQTQTLALALVSYVARQEGQKHPPAPPTSCSQLRATVLVSKLEQRLPVLVSSLLFLIPQCLLHLTAKPLHLVENKCQVVRFMVELCRPRNKYWEVKILLYNVLCNLRLSAAALSFTMLNMWPELLLAVEAPNKQSLSKTLEKLPIVEQCLLHAMQSFDGTKDPTGIYCISRLKDYLYKRYNHPPGQRTTLQLVQHLLASLSVGENKGVAAGVYLLGRRQGVEWFKKHLISGELLQLLGKHCDSRNGDLAAQVAIRLIGKLGSIVGRKDPSYLENMICTFNNLFREPVISEDLREAVGQSMFIACGDNTTLASTILNTLLDWQPKQALSRPFLLELGNWLARPSIAKAALDALLFTSSSRLFTVLGSAPQQPTNQAPLDPAHVVKATNHIPPE